MSDEKATTWYWVAALAGTLIAVGPSQALAGRSGWMWTSSGDPYGAGNILPDTSKQASIIREFKAWGFDRIYTSLDSLPATAPDKIANWNAKLDGAGIESQMLLGEPTWVFPNVRTSLLNIIQERLIDFNASRADPSQWIDAVHLDIEPHTLNQWSTGTNADRRDLLLDLRDTYADVRGLLDANGQTQVKIYADLPVWYDSSVSIGWAAGERDSWFDGIAQSLDGISLMAFERGTFSSIQNGVQWEISNFNREVRVGLEASAVGPGETWPDFNALMAMATQIESFYGQSITGVDFQPLRSFAELASFSFLQGDVNGDGFVGIADLNVLLGSWNQTVELGNWGQGDLAGTGDGFIGISDLNVVLGNWNAGTPPTAGAAVPEPAACLLLGVLGLLIPGRPNRS